MLERNVYKELEDIVGRENISEEPAILDGYAWQPTFNPDPNLWVPRPIAAILPQSTEEVQKIVKVCSIHKIKFKAHSTGWGAIGGAGSEGVMLVDLRRMNRILEIDEKNMYALVEPYVICAQLQAEVMRKGLDCHIIGAGSNTSVLASCTSVGGVGSKGLSTSYNARNVLGVEWVLPTGEILKIGSAGTGDSWFSGDGPGPGLRGIYRGLTGALGGLGIFTKCAVKLFPWWGPKDVKIEGPLFNVKTEVPENYQFHLCLFPNWDKFADAMYRVGEAEIGFMLSRDPFGLSAACLAPRLLSKITKYPSIRDLIKRLAAYRFEFGIGASSKRELEYQEKVLKKIVSENEGIVIDLKNIPPLHRSIFWSLAIRSSLSAFVFRIGGNFASSFGGDGAIDFNVNQAKVGADIKQKLIDEGLFFDDLADNAWILPYENCLMGHTEELAFYDPRDPKQVGAPEELRNIETDESIEKSLGVGMFVSGPINEKLGPAACNYHIWEKRIKKAFDPLNLSDAAHYISVESEE